MRKKIFIAVVVILAMVGGLIAYGIYLNTSGENKISERLANKKVPLRVEKAAVRVFYPEDGEPHIRLEGEDMVDAMALNDGRIKQVLVKKNDRVTNGQPLFEIVDEQLPAKRRAAESNVAKADSALTKAQNSYNRYIRLRNRNAASQEKLEEAEAAYKAAQASLSESEAQLEQLMVQEERQVITSPADGVILMAYRQNGAHVTSGMVLATVGNFSTLNFSISTSNAFFTQLDVGDILQMSVLKEFLPKIYGTDYAENNQGISERFTATVTAAEPGKGRENSLIRTLNFKIDNSAGILEARNYAMISFVAEKPFTGLTIPQEAFSEDLSTMDSETDGFVFIVNENNVLQKRRILVGRTDYKYYEVVSGVQEGELVVTSGQEGLEEGMQVDVKMESGTDEG